MSISDAMNHGRPSKAASVTGQASRNFVTTGPAPVPISVESSAQGDSSQLPNVRRRDASPSPFFPIACDGTSAEPLLNTPYTAVDPSGIALPHVLLCQPQKAVVRDTTQVTRINPPPVQHSASVEQEINSFEPPVQSIIRYYSSDSKEYQQQAIDFILRHHRQDPPAQICSIHRRNRSPIGGIESVVCFLCSTPENSTFSGRNCLRLFTEHFVHEHLLIEKPFACFSCGQSFPFSQDRDRHEKAIHRMYRPKAHAAWLRRTRARLPKSPPYIEGNTPSTLAPLVSRVSKESTTRSRPHKRDNELGRRSQTPVPDRRTQPYGQATSGPSTPHQSRLGGGSTFPPAPPAGYVSPMPPRRTPSGTPRVIPSMGNHPASTSMGHSFPVQSAVGPFGHLQPTVDGGLPAHTRCANRNPQWSNEFPQVTQERHHEQFPRGSCSLDLGSRMGPGYFRPHLTSSYPTGLFMASSSTRGSVPSRPNKSIHHFPRGSMNTTAHDVQNRSSPSRGNGDGQYSPGQVNYDARSNTHQNTMQGSNPYAAQFDGYGYSASSPFPHYYGSAQQNRYPSEQQQHQNSGGPPDYIGPHASASASSPHPQMGSGVIRNPALNPVQTPAHRPSTYSGHPPRYYDTSLELMDNLVMGHGFPCPTNARLAPAYNFQQGAHGANQYDPPPYQR